MRKILFAGVLAGVFAASAAAQQQPSQPPAAPPSLSSPLAKPECPGNPLGGPSNGVICPPDVDPGMKIPAPEIRSKMPVISPPDGERKIESK
jgi:hypothetical protein